MIRVSQELEMYFLFQWSNQPKESAKGVIQKWVKGRRKKLKGEQRKLKLLIKRALLMKYFVTFLYSDFDHLVELNWLC